MFSSLGAMQLSMGSKLGEHTAVMKRLKEGAHKTALSLNKAAGSGAGTLGTTVSNAPNSTVTPLTGRYGTPMRSPVTGVAAPGGGASATGITGINGLPISTNSVLPSLVTMLPMELLGAVPMLASSYSSQPTSGANQEQMAANLGTTPVGTPVGDGAYVRGMTPSDVAYMTAVHSGSPQAMQEFYASSSANSSMIYHPLTGTPVPIDALNGSASSTAGTPTSAPSSSSTTGTPSASIRRIRSGPMALFERLLLSVGKLPLAWVSTAHAQATTSPSYAAAVMGLPAGGTPSNMVLVTGLSASEMAKYQNYMSESNAAITANMAQSAANTQTIGYLQEAFAQLTAMNTDLNGLRESLSETNAIPSVLSAQRNVQNAQIAVNADINRTQNYLNTNNQTLHGLLVQRNDEYNKYADLSQAEAGSKQVAILTALSQAASQNGAGGVTATPELVNTGIVPPSTPAN